MGADILAKEDNSNITIKAGNDINISAVQDYEYEKQYSKDKGGTFGTTTTREDITASLTNIKSNITAGSNLSITTGNDLTSIGTNFTAINGNMDFDIGNDLNLYNAMDYNYEYHYLKKEKFDFASAIANVGAAVAVGALTGGAGAAVMAGAASSMGASQMTKGSVDIKLDYDETTIGNNLKGNNINISTGNNATLISTNINAMNNINLDIGNELLIGSAEEKHQHKQSHESWGGDIGKAALGGAITGLATGLGVNAGAYMGAYSGVALGGATSTSALAGAYTGGILLGGSAAMGSSGVGAVISRNEQGELKGTYTTNQIGSDLTAINDINITTNNNLNIVGSDLLSGNNTILTSNNGSVNILAAIETIITEESKTKTAGKGVKFNHSGGSYTIDGKVEKKTNSNQITTQMARSSNIKSANSIVISSGNSNNTENRQDINIMGSNIIAENDILLDSNKGNINVVSQELLKEVLNKEQVQTITISTGISNTFIKTAKDAKNAMEHKNGYQDNKEGNISAGVNLAFDALNNYLTLGTLGFGFSTSVSYNNTETNTSQNAVFNQGSAIISNKGSIDLNAEKDINIKGSMISTEGENKEINLTSNNGNINIIASKDVVEMSSDTDSNSYSFGGGVGSVSPTGFNFGYDKSTSNTIAYSESYNNSSIQNKNGSINIRTKNTNNADKGNVSVIGANIEGKDINIDVANNLIVESLQNKEYSNTKSENYGGSVGGSAGAFGLNFGGGFDKKERNWVDNQTSIIGNNSVVINTKNNTNIKGAIIASGSYEDVDIPETEWTTDITSGETAKTKRVFKDNGNLVLNTGSLTYSDIYDNNTEKNQNLNVGLGTTINFGFSNGGVDIEQTTKATIGNGKITIGGHTLTDNETITQDGTIVAKSEENTGINRDVNNSQEITKNETTGGWNIDVSVNIPELLDLIDKGPEQYTKDQIDKAKENINKVKEKIEQAKNITKEQYEKIKNALISQKEELKTTYSVYLSAMAKAEPGSKEYYEAKAKCEAIAMMIDENDQALGSLSRNYESGKDGAAAVNAKYNEQTGKWESTKGDKGGFSYGDYQIETGTTDATMNKYLDYLKTCAGNDESYSTIYNLLIDAGGFDGAKAGTNEFISTWKAIATSEDFKDVFSKSQKEFIALNNYTPVANTFENTFGININDYSSALKDVLWSQSVQHSAKGNETIINNALNNGNINSNSSERDIIEALYNARADYMRNRAKMDEKIIYKRTTEERNEALRRLRDSINQLMKGK